VLERAQGDNPDRIVALIPPPFAEDAGNPIATSLAVGGSRVTMQVRHTVTDAYPVARLTSGAFRKGVGGPGVERLDYYREHDVRPAKTNPSCRP
jgi:hypothetical protein